MSVHAGTIIHVGGNNVIDRIQSAGLGDVTVPVDVVREVGNPLVVDKVPQEPDFTFTMESFDVSTELEAWLTGKVGAGPPGASGAAPGFADADGTEYRWQDVANQTLNIISPWKDPTASAGTVVAGHIIPGFYVNRVQYQFGVTDNAQETVELGGGSFYYANHSPFEEFVNGDGSTTDFVTAHPAVGYRKGGAEGTEFKWVFGVIVDGEFQTDGVDYTQTGTDPPAASAAATISFTDPPANAAKIRFVYFTTFAQAYPQAVHASTIVKPAAVRGRNICVFLGIGGERVRLGNVQAATLEATVDGTIEREFCDEEVVGRTVNGTDVTGTVTIRSKNAAAFFALLQKITGVTGNNEIIGWLNQNTIALEIQIQNPRNPAQILKTLFVSDAIFQPPGTPARVNTPTDFAIAYQSQTGDFSAFKGEMP